MYYRGNKTWLRVRVCNELNHECAISYHIDITQFVSFFVYRRQSWDRFRIKFCILM